MAARTSEVAEKAAFWVVQLRSPDRPAGCETEFADWLRASPIHVREYLRAVEIWEALAHPNTDSGRRAEDLIRTAQDGNLVGWPGHTLPDMSAPQFLHAVNGRHAMRLAIALVVAGFLGYFGWRYLSVADLTTGVGELRSAVLPDHSIVELNTQSEIRFAFNNSERRIELVRGEAFFVVAKDPVRPFVVSTDIVMAKAVGTRFSVYRRPTGTLVTVAEGKVLVRDLSVMRQSSAAAAPSAVEVIPGEQAEAQRGKPVVMHQAVLQRSLAWREHRLIFDGEPLANVVAEFNRYNVTVLVIANPRLRDQRISGVFDANDPESLIDFLVKVDHIPVSRETRGQVRIGEDSIQSERYPAQRTDRS